MIILGNVARMTAKYETPLNVPTPSRRCIPSRTKS